MAVRDNTANTNLSKPDTSLTSPSEHNVMPTPHCMSSVYVGKQMSVDAS